MYLIVEVKFYANQRKSLPLVGYRPDAIFNGNDYWGITFMELDIKAFDKDSLASVIFTFQEVHYKEVSEGQTFKIMEGSRQVGEGIIISIETNKK